MCLDCVLFICCHHLHDNDYFRKIIQPFIPKLTSFFGSLAPLTFSLVNIKYIVPFKGKWTHMGYASLWLSQLKCNFSRRTKYVHDMLHDLRSPMNTLFFVPVDGDILVWTMNCHHFSLSKTCTWVICNAFCILI